MKNEESYLDQLLQRSALTQQYNTDSLETLLPPVIVAFIALILADADDVN